MRWMTRASTLNPVSRLYVMALALAPPTMTPTQRKTSLTRLPCALMSVSAASSVWLCANASVDENRCSSFFARHRRMRTKKIGYLISAWTRRVQTRTRMHRRHGRLRPSRSRRHRYRPYGQMQCSCRRSSNGNNKGTMKRTQPRSVTFSSSDWSVSRHPASSRSSKRMPTLMMITEHIAAHVQDYHVRNESQLLKPDVRLLPPMFQLPVWDYLSSQSTMAVKILSALARKSSSQNGGEELVGMWCRDAKTSF